VVVAGRDSGKGEKVAEAIRSAGGEAFFHQVEVTDPESVENLYKAVEKKYGKLNVLLANAGILGPRSTIITDITPAEAEQLTAVNYLGVVYSVKYALPLMLKSGGGSIIATGSDSAYLGNRGHSVYCGTKAAVLAFCRAVAMEYADQKIRVNTVSPGACKTPMHAELMEGNGEIWKQVEAGIPMGRACYPEDFARTALFFASDNSEYITGANLMVDGGWLAKGL
jgi:NAD(P)-dependent dehydrogenase (short-subunit alcohol dehydrogenase family)